MSASMLRPDTGRRAARIRAMSKSLNRLPSIDIPERLKGNARDEQEDVTAPPKDASGRGAQYMNQSIFSMIAAAGSKADFNSRFDDSSEGEAADTKSSLKADKSRRRSARSKHQRGDQASPSSKRIAEEPEQHLRSDEERGRSHKDQHRTTKTSQSAESRQSSQDLQQDTSRAHSISMSPDRQSDSSTPRSAPVLSRMIEARNRYDPETATTAPPTPTPEKYSESQSENQPSRALLSTRLKEIFGFEKPERVIGEYPCWLMQSAALQGYMYVTEGHVCFYAYLPRKSNTTVKSGYLSKPTRKNLTYNRYWFQLKGDVLSYFSDPSNLYFPSGNVDLRYGISASLCGKDSKDFTVTTDSRTYQLRADSALSAKEWVKALQKVIFQAQNEGWRVKLSFPVENIIDVEESPMMDLAETFKIRVVDVNETYAIDEYYFSFFRFGKDAFQVVKDLVDGTPPQQMSQDPIATLEGKDLPKQSPFTGTTGHRSRRRSEGELNVGRKRQDSGSYIQFLEQGTESSVIVQSPTDTGDSASQILARSDVFHSPTIHRLRSNTGDFGPAMMRKESSGITSPGFSNNESPVSKDQDWSGAASEPEEGQEDKHNASSTPTLQGIVRAGTYPLQRAAGLAEYLRGRSRQMSSLLASESMGYIEKVSGMWAGGGKHYAEGGEHITAKSPDEQEAETGESFGNRFRAHFALPASEKLQATYYCYLHRVLPLYGKMYIGSSKVCFRSLLPGTRTKMILPIKEIENVEKEKGFRFGYQGLVLIIRGHEELFFEFNDSDSRDDCAVTLHQRLESMRYLEQSVVLAPSEKEEADRARAEHQLLQEVSRDPLPEDDSQELQPIFDDTRASIVSFKPSKSLRIACLTIGSRGDVQPYIALCKGLIEEGHRPVIATHREFEPWIRQHGIDFAPVEGDPAELMRICVENGMFTYSFLKEASAKFRGWIDDLLSSAWKACQGCDVLIESPSAMAGIHIAEALRIPYFRCFTMPWSRTRAYPHAFAVPEQKLGGAYNYITYVMFDNVFWKAISGQVNRWRKNELGLRSTSLDKLQPNKVPFIYNYSPSVVPPPLDYPDWIHVTGYWFLDEGKSWTPPAELTEFIARARRDSKKIVYIGFGSIVVSDPAALTRTVVESVLKADVRCILSKGWSDRLGDPASNRVEIPLPPEIHQIQAAPHDWLFTQIDAAAHHGGSGTTGASLRAGVPTIIKPFFGDQFFMGSRVEDLGVGICLKKLNVGVFSRALWEATHSERMILKARRLGEQIRKENGVATAIQCIYRDLEYAGTLTRNRAMISSTPYTPTGTSEPGLAEEELDELEETWTFIDDDTDLELAKKEVSDAQSG